MIFNSVNTESGYNRLQFNYMDLREKRTVLDNPIRVILCADWCSFAIFRPVINPANNPIKKWQPIRPIAQLLPAINIYKRIFMLKKK